MVSSEEMHFRLKQFFRFSKQEIAGLAAGSLVTGFIFSFRDWGETTFDPAVGFAHFMIASLLALLAFIFHFSWAKYHGLEEGYKVTYKPWWIGMLIALILAFVSFGRLPVVLIGGVNAAFMVKQRIGEFRYGFSYEDNAMIGFWGIIGNMVLAIILGIGYFFFPESYFLETGLWISLIMGLCTLIPIPQQSGLAILFGSRSWYGLSFIMVIGGAILLLTRTAVGLGIVIAIGLISWFFNDLLSSDI